MNNIITYVMNLKNPHTDCSYDDGIYTKVSRGNLYLA